MVIFFLFVLLVVYLYGSCYWVKQNRSYQLVRLVRLRVGRLFSSSGVVTTLYFTLMIILLFLNFISNTPFSSSPTLYYWFTFSVSLLVWAALMRVVFSVSRYSFLAHMMPYGAPMFLGLLLPLIEIFRQIIRPLTLIIRLRTNLSAGHIIMFIFSFFSSFSFTLVLLITPLLVVLLILELAISLLQAYIFSSLSYIYIEESLNL